jgi:hypothetical protein
MSNDNAEMFRYSEECLRQTIQEMDWSLELSNIRNISKSISCPPWTTPDAEGTLFRNDN